MIQASILVIIHMELVFGMAVFFFQQFTIAFRICCVSARDHLKLLFVVVRNDCCVSKSV